MKILYYSLLALCIFFFSLLPSHSCLENERKKSEETKLGYFTLFFVSLFFSSAHFLLLGTYGGGASKRSEDDEDGDEEEEGEEKKINETRWDYSSHNISWNTEANVEDIIIYIFLFLCYTNNASVSTWTTATIFFRGLFFSLWNSTRLLRRKKTPSHFLYIFSLRKEAYLHDGKKEDGEKNEKIRRRSNVMCLAQK